MKESHPQKSNLDLTTQLREYAIYSPREIKQTNMQELLSGYDLELIGIGMNARVFRLKGTDWVVKEGRWDMKLVLPAGVAVPMPVKLLKKGMEFVAFDFFPDKAEVARQYKQYLNLVEYMGYFGKQAWYRRAFKDYYHPNIDLINSAQKAIRTSLAYYIPQLEKYYNFKFEPGLEEVLKSPVKYHNFLPAEYLLYGESISPANKGKSTYFIFQKFIQGKLLHDVEKDTWPRKLAYEMILFSYLLLLMNYQLHIIPDTRPRNYTEVITWLTKTDNIVVSGYGAKFVDTRWYWETRSFNPTRRGFIVSELAINAYKKAINQFLNELK